MIWMSYNCSPRRLKTTLLIKLEIFGLTQRMTGTAFRNDSKLYSSGASRQALTAHTRDRNIFFFEKPQLLSPLNLAAVQSSATTNTYVLLSTHACDSQNIRNNIEQWSYNILRSKQSACNEAKLQVSPLIEKIKLNISMTLNYILYDFGKSAVCNDTLQPSCPPTRLSPPATPSTTSPSTPPKNPHAKQIAPPLLQLASYWPTRRNKTSYLDNATWSWRRAPLWIIRLHLISRPGHHKAQPHIVVSLSAFSLAIAHL